MMLVTRESFYFDIRAVLEDRDDGSIAARQKEKNEANEYEQNQRKPRINK